MKISQLLDGIENLEMVMPEFQREYVWSKEHAKQLMVSLFRDYPTGGLLLWETNEPPEIKNRAIQPNKTGLTKVILDGQQRLTTLYLLIRGLIPPYYTENDLLTDPRHLYFNLLSGEFQYYMKSKMDGNPIWQKVMDCYDPDKVDPIDIAEEYHHENDETDYKTLVKNINRNLTCLKVIETKDLPILTVPSSARIDDAIEVFDRANSLGTKLTDAELVLTHITGKWSHCRKTMKEKMVQFKDEKFDLSLSFLTRCMVITLTDSALFNKNAKLKYENFTREEYKDAWFKVSKALDYLIPILKHDGLISSTVDMSTLNVLVPIIAHLINNDNKFTGNTKYAFLYWMFLALIWARYSGQVDQKLDKDVHITLNDPTPLKDLVAQIEDQRGRLKIKAADLEGRGAGHPLFRMLYIITKNKKAIDWSNGSEIHGTIGDYYSIHSHHIFPKAVLYRNGYNPENHLDKKKVNEIANRAFVTRDTNYAISDKKPIDYLQSIDDLYPGALEKQFIPLNQDLWEIDRFEDFLRERRKLIAKEINNFIDEFRKQSTQGEYEIIDWLDIIDRGENNFIEFKSSLRWDYYQNQFNKKMEYVIVKTINAFLNSEGGQLFIGVSDEGNILGLENDYSTLGKKQGKDEFQLKMVGIINKFLGKEFHQYITMTIVEIEGKEICVVNVARSNTPTFLKYGVNEQFFIRASSSSQPLGLKETMEYIANHWEN